MIDSTVAKNSTRSAPEGEGLASSTARGERLALAQEAFERYYIRCFWFMDPSLQITEDLLPRIVDGLHRNGDRQAFQLASELCR